MKMNFIGSLCLVILVSACGGGGGGDKSPATSSSSSSVVANTLTANAGADITVNEGSKVDLDPIAVVTNPTGFTSGSGNLEITGSSARASDIVKLKWTLQQGGPFGISTSDTTSGRFSFNAPDTGTANSIQVTYQLTLTNAAGQTASDTITITVNRVNQAPTANAGTDQEAQSEAVVSISGSTSNDVDGTIQSYAWTQTSGTSITLNDADKATATFTAPTLLEATQFEFQLTITDNDNVTATDKVLVLITPKDAPVVSIYFPTPVGVYKESTISAFGSATAVNANLSKVEVSTGGDFTEATLSDGKWRLDNIAVPATDTFEIIVKVTDSLGRISQKKSSLKKSDDQMGIGSTWNGTSALTLNYDINTLYAITDSGLSTSSASDVKLISIDLKNSKKQVVSEFDNSNLGPILYPVRSAIWARDTTKIYGVISTSGGTKAILSIDTQTGTRAIVSDSTHGTGTNFSNPVGIAYTDANTAKLFVTDNGANSIFTIDVATGNRTVASNSSNENFSYLISIPDGNLDLYTAPNFNANTPFYSAGILAYAAGGVTTFPTTSIYSQTGNKGTGPDPSTPLKALFGKTRTGIAANKTIVVDAANRVFEIDIVTGNRTLLFTNENKITAAVLHTFYDVLFISEDDDGHQALSAIDLVAGNKVTFIK
jgi:PKD domain